MITVDYIRKILKRKKEDIILDLYLQNYDSGNYYLALVFNNKIQKYRVLYVPIDFVKNNFNFTPFFDRKIGKYWNKKLNKVFG